MSGPYLLDTSALLAHYQEEPGHDVVERLLAEQRENVFVSAITWLEFHLRLKELIPSQKAREEVLAIYDELLADALPVTRETACAAYDLRQQLPSRLPNGDALIAATAKLQGATLVHRDPHLAGIPEKLVKQIVLPQKTKADPPRKT
jgi:predicted nucleic acid-binding protein